MKLQYLSLLFLLYAGTCGIHCATTTQAPDSKNKDGGAVRLTTKIIHAMFSRFKKSVIKLREQNVTIQTEDLKGTDLTKSYPNVVVNSTDNHQTHTEIRCNYAESLQIKLQQLPTHQFSRFGSPHLQMIVKDFNVTLTKNIKVTQPILTYKTNFIYDYEGTDQQLRSSNYAEVRTLLEPALNATLGAKFRRIFMGNNSILQYCENPVSFKRSLVSNYIITIKDVQKSFLYDINFDRIILTNLWNFKSFALNQPYTSNLTNFTLQFDAIRGEIYWNYTVHANNDTKSDPITTIFKIGMLKITGLFNSKKESRENLDVAVEGTTTSEATCGNILEKILLRRVKHVIEKYLKELLTAVIR